MAMMSIRGLDENILRELKACAKREGISLNSLALRLLNEGYFSKKTAEGGYHDLDALAGRWSREDEEEFGRNTSTFSEIDPDLWK